MTVLDRLVTPARAGLLLLAFALCAPAAVGQMPQGNMEMLSSSDVSDQQLQKVARIIVTARMSTQAEMKKMRKDAMAMKKKMAQMDSTQKAQARRKFRKRQMALQKKRMKIIQKQAKEEGMDMKMIRRITQSARQDSTLQRRLNETMKAEMKNQMQQGGGSGQQGGGSGR